MAGGAQPGEVDPAAAGFVVSVQTVPSECVAARWQSVGPDHLSGQVVDLDGGRLATLDADLDVDVRPSPEGVWIDRTQGRLFRKRGNVIALDRYADGSEVLASSVIHAFQPIEIAMVELNFAVNVIVGVGFGGIRGWDRDWGYKYRTR